MKNKWKKKKLGTVDLNTGELEQGVAVYVKAKVRWHEDWTMLMQEAFGLLAQDKSFTLEMWRVWSYLVSKLGFENWIIVPQAEISAALDMRKENVSRAIKKLVQKQMLLKGPKVGRTNAYKINSKYVWKGTVNNLSKDRMGEVKDFHEELAKRKKL